VRCPIKIEYVDPGVSEFNPRKKSAVLPIVCAQSISVSEPHEPSNTKTLLKQAKGVTLLTEIFISAAEATNEYQTPEFGTLNSVQLVESPPESTDPPQVLPATHEELTIKGVAVAHEVFVGLH
tara:strand:+ start:2041 stop:2409 length:369 start_codon:yes stop_codon:yes gene_type:complete